MSTQTINSEWRDKRFEWHGEGVRDYLRETFPRGTLFSVQDASKADCLAHLSDKYAYDVAIACCRQLFLLGKLKRQGVLYYRPKRRRSRRRDWH